MAAGNGIAEMTARTFAGRLVLAGLMAAVPSLARAQQTQPTVPFADSIAVLIEACTRDIDTHCAGVNLGSNRLKNCLSRNQATLTPACRDVFGKVHSQISSHAQAQIGFLKRCEADTKKLCPGEAGDTGATIECLLSAKRLGWRCAMAKAEANFSATQERADVVDAVRILSAPVSQLDLDVKDIHAQALVRAKKPSKPQDRPPLVEDLDGRPQLDLDIQFNFDSAIVRPESLKLLGQVADALFSPRLLDRKILIVSHTESTSKRSANLELSHKRAAAIREILVTTFRVSPQRVFALGLGEEQLADRSKPAAPANRRTQLIVLGKR
jgi:outer membrane protein OmpA-like peptidoglycan-associated protein